MTEEKHYLSLQEAAALLGIAPITFRKLVSKKIIEPEFKIGMNNVFSKYKVNALKVGEIIESRSRARYKSIRSSRYRLYPPTKEELEFLKQDLNNKLDRVEYCRKHGTSRQRLQAKIYSIAYRKFYFEVNRNNKSSSHNKN